MTATQELTQEQQVQEQQQKMAARAAEIRTNAMLDDLTRQISDLARRNAIIAGEMAVKDDIIEQMRTALVELDQKYKQLEEAAQAGVKESEKTK